MTKEKSEWEKILDDNFNNPSIPNIGPNDAARWIMQQLKKQCIKFERYEDGLLIYAIDHLKSLGVPSDK